MEEPSSNPAAPVGLTPHHYNYLKCWFTLTYDGKEVFHRIFDWGFRDSSFGIKGALFQLPNYSNARYRSDFDASQRKKIEADDRKDFDLNLFYLLLQRVCSLPVPSHKEWGKGGDSNGLPNTLYQIKMKRNTLAHRNVEMTELEMLREIDELKSLFNRALDLAAAIYNVPKDVFSDIQEAVNIHIISIKSSNATISEQNMKQIAQEKATLALNEAQSDLFVTYKHFSKVLLAPWTVAETFQNIKDVFTEPLIKQTKNNILFQQMTEEESIINLKDILNSKLPDNSTPNFILLLSPSGMGKTTLVKYLIQSWIERNCLIKGLDAIDLVFYMDCRVSRVCSFDDLISNLIPNTVKIFDKRELKITIMTMQVLVILDNIDEISEEALPTYEELLKLNSDRFRILATSTHILSRALNKKCHQKHLKLQLEGIPNSNINACISKMYTSLYSSETSSTTDEEVEMFISEYISKTQLHSSEAIRSPEILSHVFFHWLMQSQKDTSYTTKTHLFLTTHELLSLKLLEKVGTKSQTNLFEQKMFYDKLKMFFDEFFRIAYQTLERNETELITSVFNELIDICKKLGLPHSILNEILCIKEKEVRSPLDDYASITFPSNSLQVFYCANHIINLFTSDEIFNFNGLGESFFENLVKRNQFILLMKFIIGILSCNDNLKLENNIETIFLHIYKYCPDCTSNLWLEISEETRCQSSVIFEAKKYMGDSWALEDQEISPGLITILKNHPPKQITLTTSSSPNSIFFLKKILEICSSIPCLSINLHMYHNFWVNKNQTCDDYFNILCRNQKSIQIESFAGKLSSDFLLRVPSTLKRLALHIKPEDITILNTSLPKLINLMLLYLNLDVTFNFPSKRVPRLRMPSYNILLYVDIWNVDQEHIDWACNVAASFSPAYCRLAVRKSSLNYNGSKQLLEGLRDRRVHVDTLIIGTTKSFTEEEESHLLKLALSFECSEVKVIQI